jgi:hypothetical protein
MVQEQGGLCALCSEPGSADGLVVDADDLRKKIRGLVHRKMQDLSCSRLGQPTQIPKGNHLSGARRVALSAAAAFRKLRRSKIPLKAKTATGCSPLNPPWERKHRLQI